MNDSLFQRVKMSLNSQHYTMNDSWLHDCIDYYVSQNVTPAQEEVSQFVISQWLLSDLREINNENGCLPRNLSERSSVLPDKYILQMDMIYDISVSKYKQLEKIRKVNTANIEETEREAKNDDYNAIKPKRMMQLALTDGIQNILAIEYKPIRFLKDVLLPGFKVMIKGPVKCRRGVLLLEETNFAEVGGEVESLLITNAIENIFARALKLEENPDPYNDKANDKANQPSTHATTPANTASANVPVPANVPVSTNVSVPAFTTASEQIIEDDFCIDDFEAIEEIERQCQQQITNQNKGKSNQAAHSSSGNNSKSSTISKPTEKSKQTFMDDDDYFIEMIDESMIKAPSPVKNVSNSTVNNKRNASVEGDCVDLTGACSSYFFKPSSKKYSQKSKVNDDFSKPSTSKHIDYAEPSTSKNSGKSKSNFEKPSTSKNSGKSKSNFAKPSTSKNVDYPDEYYEDLNTNDFAKPSTSKNVKNPNNYFDYSDECYEDLSKNDFVKPSTSKSSVKSNNKFRQSSTSTCTDINPEYFNDFDEWDNDFSKPPTSKNLEISKSNLTEKSDISSHRSSAKKVDYSKSHTSKTMFDFADESLDFNDDFKVDVKSKPPTGFDDDWCTNTTTQNTASKKNTFSNSNKKIKDFAAQKIETFISSESIIKEFAEDNFVDVKDNFKSNNETFLNSDTKKFSGTNTPKRKGSLNFENLKSRPAPTNSTATKRSLSEMSSPPLEHQVQQKIRCVENTPTSKFGSKKITDYLQKSKATAIEPPKICDFISEVLSETATDAPRVRLLRGKVMSMVKLNILHSRFYLEGKIKDGTGELDVVFSSEVLEKIIGLSVQEFLKKRKESKNNPSLREELRKMLKKAQDVLQVMDTLMNVEFRKESTPTVVIIKEMTDEQKNIIEKRAYTLIESKKL